MAMKNRLPECRAGELSARGRGFLAILIGLTICGCVLRVLCCFWGYPYVLHPDEPTVVTNAADMLSRHSWIANSYNRPDQFEIKFDAILFWLYSWIRYRMPVSEAFALYEGDFYVIARLFTAVLGTMMIPLAALFAGKSLRNDRIAGRRFTETAQLLAAGFTAFFPIFVQNSAYATPDIPLAFFSLLIAYLSLFYMENGSWKTFCAISVLTGICISIKYPAAVLCPYIALIAIRKAIRTGGKREIWRAAAVSVGLILVTMFVLAPNLFIHLRLTIRTIRWEARPNHVGADGLGFFGNLCFYLREMVRNMGVLSVPLFVAGIVYMCVHRDVRHLGMAVSAIYWVCLSALSLHWERWGIPMYTGYGVLAAIGAAWLLALAGRCGARRIAQAAVCLCLLLPGANMGISSLALTKWTLSEDTRIQATEFCEAQGITRENSIVEGYTILNALDARTCFEQFVYADGVVAPIAEQADKMYYIHSSWLSDLYYGEPERYAEECGFYDAVTACFPVAYVFEGCEYGNEAVEVRNIAEKLQYLAAPAQTSGYDVFIYDIQQGM